MQEPLEIVYRGIVKTREIDNLIREKAAKLEQVCDHIVSCHIAVEQPQRHQRRGNPYRVRINARVPPRHEVIITREASGGDLHDPLAKVIRNAFQAAWLKLKKLDEKQAGRVKAHPQQESQAFVTKLFPKSDYGFVETHDGDQVYFHRHSVLNLKLEDMKIGDAVRLVTQEGSDGPQASTVERVEPVKKR